MAEQAVNRRQDCSEQKARVLCSAAEITVSALELDTCSTQEDTAAYVVVRKPVGSDILEVVYVKEVSIADISSLDVIETMYFAYSQTHPLMFLLTPHSRSAIPFVYGSSSQKIIRLNLKAVSGSPGYQIDKRRSLRVLSNAIESGKVRFLRQDKGWKHPEDLVHTSDPNNLTNAVNLACSAIWYMTSRYPQTAGTI